MNFFNRITPNNLKSITWIAILVAIPAFWVNLDNVAVIDDEGIRAQVALEMIYTGDYVVPRMFGEFYYKKPPLFNWIIASFFKLTGNDTEWASRTVTLIFLGFYTWLIYFFFKREWGVKLAWWTAFATLTCGRILFWDSMLGLIDITFSLVVFVSFMLMYRYRERGAIKQLYLSTYLLTAVGFMLKALPAIAFQGLSLIATWFGVKKWRPFFHPWHFIAGIICLGILGIYYLFYSKEGDLSVLFPTLLFESSQRTPVHYGIMDTLVHLLEFPLEMLYHFFPWSLLILWIPFYGNFRRILTDPFARFLSLIFLFNIWLYWISPEVYPRYLLMLAPLYFGVGLFIYEKHESNNDLAARIIRWSFVTIALLAAVACILGLILVPEVRILSFWPIKGILVVTSMLVTTVFMIRSRAFTIPGMVLLLLLFRLGFSLFVLPLREDEQYSSITRDDALRIGEKYQGEPLRIAETTFLNPSTGYYLTRAYGDVVPKVKGDINKDGIYIIDTEFYQGSDYQVLDSMRIPQHKKTVLIVSKK
jgi:4-amino-4-deoxy-L-arabinose transferase-like glycosyltransferase